MMRRFAASAGTFFLLANLLAAESRIPKPKTETSFYAEAARQAARPAEPEKRAAKRKLGKLPVIVGLAVAGALAGALVALHDDNKTGPAPQSVSPGTPSISGPR